MPCFLHINDACEGGIKGMRKVVAEIKKSVYNKNIKI